MAEAADSRARALAAPSDPSTIDAAFSEVVERGRQRIAIACGDRLLTYGELDRAAEDVRTGLCRAGVYRGTLVGLLAHRAPETIAAMLGILRAGAGYVPLDASYPAEVLNQILEDSRPAATIFQGMPQASCPDDARFGRRFNIDSFCRMTAADPPAERRARTDGVGSPCPAPARQSSDLEDVAYVMFTSGSTGRPKGVVVPHRGVTRLVRGCNFASLSDDEVILHLSPISFDASTFEIWGALLNGGRLAIVPDPYPSLQQIADAIRHLGVTTAWMTAGLFHLMAEQCLHGLAPLRQLLAGGDVLSVPHVRKVLQGVPECRVINGYGPTENTTFTCCYPIPAELPECPSIPIGRPIQGTTVHILDEAMAPVPDGEVGELYAGGFGVALGYLDQPGLTAEKFVPNRLDAQQPSLLYRTGDLVRRMEDGNIEFLGRADRQIKVNGKRVELDAVEAALRTLPSVRDAAAVAWTVEGAGRRIAAFLVGAGPDYSLNASELRSMLRGHLPDFMIPGAFHLVEALPLTPMGKVDRLSLSREAAAAAAAATAPVMSAHGSPTERSLSAIWRRVLQRSQVDPDENFFDMGATSLQVIEAHAAISEQLGVSLSVVDLFQSPTIRQLARRCAGTDASGAALEIVSQRTTLRRSALARAHALRRGTL